MLAGVYINVYNIRNLTHKREDKPLNQNDVVCAVVVLFFSYFFALDFILFVNQYYVKPCQIDSELNGQLLNVCGLENRI